MCDSQLLTSCDWNLKVAILRGVKKSGALLDLLSSHLITRYVCNDSQVELCACLISGIDIKKLDTSALLARLCLSTNSDEKSHESR